MIGWPGPATHPKSRMRFTPQFLDELRARLPVSEVVGKRVKLRKAGREWKGLSPFQQEKTPSFTVNDQKQFYHDFSTGKHGNIFDFVMETEGVSFPEAVERLARLTHRRLEPGGAFWRGQAERLLSAYVWSEGKTPANARLTVRDVSREDLDLVACWEFD